MKKLILGIAVVAAGIQLHALAEDAILYWQVPTSVETFAPDYSYAYLYAQMDGDGNVLPPQGGGWAYNKAMALDGKVAEASMAGIVGTVNSFFVEYFNEVGEKIGYSDSATFGALANLGYIENRQSNPPISHTDVWNPNFNAVPEPTSGLLMLIGLAGLALRRKRA